MAPQATFDMGDELTPEQKKEQLSVMKQGEQIIQAQQEDKQRQIDDAAARADEIDLIDGKFKTQEDLLKAYKELEKKLSSGEPVEQEEPVEEPIAEPEAQPDEAVQFLFDVNKRYAEAGSFSEEDVQKLSSMDSADLVRAYQAYFEQTRQQAEQSSMTSKQLSEIKAAVGGDDAYAEMVAWAGQNLSEQEISDFNSVTQGGNIAAVKYAVEGLVNRYRNAVGYEGNMVTSGRAASTKNVYRSNAELMRDIQDPRYATDPAFQRDVEEKLARSAELM